METYVELRRSLCGGISSSDVQSSIRSNADGSTVRAGTIRALCCCRCLERGGCSRRERHRSCSFPSCRFTALSSGGVGNLGADDPPWKPRVRLRRRSSPHPCARGDTCAFRRPVCARNPGGADPNGRGRRSGPEHNSRRRRSRTWRHAGDPVERARRAGDDDRGTGASFAPSWHFGCCNCIAPGVCCSLRLSGDSSPKQDRVFSDESAAAPWGGLPLRSAKAAGDPQGIACGQTSCDFLTSDTVLRSVAARVSSAAGGGSHGLLLWPKRNCARTGSWLHG